MAHIRITNRQGNTIERTYYFCEVKSSWSADWAIVPYLVPVRATRTAAPTVAQARFRYDYGRVHRVDGETAWQTDEPLDLDDKFVRIRMQRGASTSTLWTGVFAHDARTLRGAYQDTYPQGVQGPVAYGLEHLLDRIELNTAWVRPGSGEDPVQIDWLPPFNERTGRGLVGNRSASQADGSYVFAAPGDASSAGVWTNYDIAEYLLHYHSPDTVTFGLGGQRDTLNELLEAHEFAGLSVRQALNRLIPRSRGLGWTVDADADTGNPEIRVFSLFGRTASLGAISVAGNKNVADIDFDSDELIDEAVLTLSTSNRYEAVRAEGERMVCCGTFSIADGTLEPCWTSAEEDAYKAVTADTAAAADAARRADKYAHVYRRFRVPMDWDWRLGDGLGSGHHVLVPTSNALGQIDAETSASCWRAYKTFLRQLPVFQERGQADADPELMPPLVFVRDPDTSDWYQVDAVEAENLDPMQVRMADTELAIDLRPRVNHCLALNHGFSADTEIDPQFDYSTLVATLALESDRRCAVEAWNITGPIQPGRMKRIRVPGAAQWFVALNTATGVLGGALERHNNGSWQLVRDDSAYLQCVAALAAAWYARTRASIRVTRRFVSMSLMPGMYVRDVSGSQRRQQVGTCVTSTAWDFDAQRTDVETAHAELDFLDAAGADRESPTARRVADLERRAAHLPLRVPTGGGGAGGGVSLYKVTGVDGDTADAKRVNADGTTTGEAVTFTIMPQS